MERGRGGREIEGKRGQEREREREREREKGGRPMACGVRGSPWPGWCCRSCRGWSLQYTLTEAQTQTQTMVQTPWYGMVWHGVDGSTPMVWYGMVWYGMVLWYGRCQCIEAGGHERSYSYRHRHTHKHRHKHMLKYRHRHRHPHTGLRKTAGGNLFILHSTKYVISLKIRCRRSKCGRYGCQDLCGIGGQWPGKVNVEGFFSP